MERSLDFQRGERVELTYWYVEPKPHPGVIIRVTATSIHIQFDAEDTPCRFVLSEEQWRSEFGRAVSVSRVGSIA